MRGAFRQILNDTALMERIRSLEPDLMILFNMPGAREFVVLPYVLGIKFVFLGPYHDLHGYRVPFVPSASPFFLTPFDVNEELDLGQRIKNTLQNVALYLINEFVLSADLLSEFAPAKPWMSVPDMMLKAELFLVESDHILDVTKPLLPNTKLIGGTASSQAQPLRDPFKIFVENSENGVVVVSFGSSIVNLPQEVADKLASAFQRLNQTVVWRVNMTSSDPGKVMTSMWLPQNDLLAQAQTRLFVSHCGSSGQYEALYHGVPLLCLPLCCDQYYNAYRSSSKGFGLTADVFSTTDDQLYTIMAEILNNATYRDNIRRASKLFRELYKEPQAEAAFWIDHVMKYGGGYMRWAGQDIPQWQFLGLDVLACAVGCVVVIVSVVRVVSRMCLGISCRRERKLKSE
ncbi:UDP-glucuronosyltransferase 1A4 [Aplysia californica]|uniref:UDP-glucuronosyltransferase n=1 Tax=Aplysia californica TaxID=6500 RepID=A0ABM1A0L2_APLCA|nr:UDP-glucuronosyltransferase 1A4 [Aplysia californica]